MTREQVIKELEREVARKDRKNVADLEWLDCVEVKLLQDALVLLKAQDTELERLKNCRAECKIDCLLQEYNALKEKYDGLMKAQEPRVMTLEEMQEAAKNGDAVYVEESSEGSYAKCFWGLVVDGIEPPKDGGYNYPGGVLFNVVDSCSDMWDGDFYGLKTPLGWRCWTSRPTDEQREAVKWDA